MKRVLNPQLNGTTLKMGELVNLALFQDVLLVVQLVNALLAQIVLTHYLMEKSAVMLKMENS